jgi:hypothetical protein
MSPYPLAGRAYRDLTGAPLCNRLVVEDPRLYTKPSFSNYEAPQLNPMIVHWASPRGEQPNNEVEECARPIIIVFLPPLHHQHHIFVYKSISSPRSERKAT